jgi:hypothetical protein
VYEKRHLDNLARNDRTAVFFSDILKNKKESYLFMRVSLDLSVFQQVFQKVDILIPHDMAV